MSNEPSEMFMTILVGAATYGGITCQCGKEYLCCNEGLNPDPEDIEEFKEKATKEPDKYFPWEYAIGMADIDGKTFVEGCSCNSHIAKIENWINSHEYIILEYFTQKQTAIQEEADRLKRLLNVKKGPGNE